ncbi:MAG: KGGVGR-motif variant AAA ATPase [Blastocatellia bacterium]
MDEPRSTIVTFYSYKGGVGRSMALANVAWLLAQNYKKKVLVVDWDLEAPGLHRFFGIADHEIRDGLLDMLYDYKQILRKATESLPEDPVPLGRYVQKAVNFSGAGSISILPAGRQNGEYAGRVNQFDWQEFYTKWHGYGFIENLKKQMRDAAEIILVDSRTGVTDIGGICTLQLPDVVALLFALNEQNINGVARTAGTILEKAPEVAPTSPPAAGETTSEGTTEAPGKRHPPVIILRPSRVERYLEEDKRKAMEKLAAERLKDYLPESERANALRFITKKNIPYVGAYSFAETPLAADKSPLSEMSEAFEDLAKSILDTTVFRDEIATALPRWNSLYRLLDGYSRLGASKQFLAVSCIILFVISTGLLARNQQLAGRLGTETELSQRLSDVTKEKEQLTKEREQLAEEKEQLTYDKGQLAGENEQLTKERDDLKQQLATSQHPPPPADNGMKAIAIDNARTFTEASIKLFKYSGPPLKLARLVIYFKSPTFRIVARYASAAEAKANLDLVRKQVNPSAYLINLDHWCSKPVAQDGYMECLK